MGLKWSPFLVGPQHLRGIWLEWTPKHMCYNEIGLCALNMLSISGLATNAIKRFM